MRLHVETADTDHVTTFGKGVEVGGRVSVVGAPAGTVEDILADLVAAGGTIADGVEVGGGGGFDQIDVDTELAEGLLNEFLEAVGVGDLRSRGTVVNDVEVDALGRPLGAKFELGLLEAFLSVFGVVPTILTVSGFDLDALGIEEVLNDPENEEVIAKVRAKVNDTMKNYPLFAY